MSTDLDPALFDRFAREAFRYEKPPRCLITPFGVFTWQDGAVEVMDYDDEGNLCPMTADQQEAAVRAFGEMLGVNAAQPAPERR